MPARTSRLGHHSRFGTEMRTLRAIDRARACVICSRTQTFAFEHNPNHAQEWYGNNSPIPCAKRPMLDSLRGSGHVFCGGQLTLNRCLAHGEQKITGELPDLQKAKDMAKKWRKKNSTGKVIDTHRVVGAPPARSSGVPRLCQWTPGMVRRTPIHTAAVRPPPSTAFATAPQHRLKPLGVARALVITGGAWTITRTRCRAVSGSRGHASIMACKSGSASNCGPPVGPPVCGIRVFPEGFADGSSPSGNRTPACGSRVRCPEPLDERGMFMSRAVRTRSGPDGARTRVSWASTRRFTI